VDEFGHTESVEGSAFTPETKVDRVRELHNRDRFSTTIIIICADSRQRIPDDEQTVGSVFQMMK
jgi:hypothetical protein